MAKTPSLERPELDDRVVARVPAATREALRQAALRHHRTPGGELRAAIDAWLNGPEMQRTQGATPGLSKTVGGATGNAQSTP